MISRLLLMCLVCISAKSLANEPLTSNGPSETRSPVEQTSPRDPCEDLGFIDMVRAKALNFISKSRRFEKCGVVSELKSQLLHSDQKYFSIAVSDDDFRKQSVQDYRLFGEASQSNENHSGVAGSVVFANGVSREKTELNLPTLPNYSTIESEY